ncbi:hypothetical protein U9M48_042591 [Paspalum notatum var. saurae]|uniref:Reverse transcriptase domain-containing protein n=1 Tax=Paspalum notatum var. saurae TaxID=547442 RepID=A0AAQ3USW4_PASNO
MCTHDHTHENGNKGRSPIFSVKGVRAEINSYSTKWGLQHNCPSSVSVNVVEELWQMVSNESENYEMGNPTKDTDSREDLMALSAQAVSGTTSNRTIKLYGHIHHHSALLLVDSGSSHNFISEQFATRLTPWRLLKQPIQVKVVDGGILLCTHELEFCPWLVQGHQFQTTFKILPLKCYDAVLGIEWLDQNCPLSVQWAEKWFSFHHFGKEVKLQGVLDFPLKCLDQVYALHNSQEVWCVVQLCAVTSNLAAIESTPEHVQGKHTIPLLPGTQPFRLRPYRYNPLQETEIEQQVAQLLQNKMIVDSTSPLASPVLLVKNKSGERRLCVDYRRLNAHTIKNKFPLPIIEELFEELVGVAGFHQIPMAEEDQYKTAYQTHFGHFEYKVMPYGLTEAPATFQATMNYILAALLRKCVVVFIDDILIYSRTFEEHMSHLQRVFDILQQYQFKIRLILAISSVKNEWPQILKRLLLFRNGQLHNQSTFAYIYWQQKALTKLLGLNYKICYKKGSSNSAADALSRRVHSEAAEMNAISVAQQVWLQDLVSSYQDSAKASEIISIIKYKGHIWLSHSDSLQQEVLSALHASPIGGHSGFLVTYTRTKKLFYWVNMKKKVQMFVASCTVCQQAKTERVPYPGLLKPLEVLEHAWQVISMDFVEGLPTSFAFNCILVVVDKFLKYAHFVQLSHPL